MKVEVDFDDWLTLNKNYGEARGILGAWLWVESGGPDVLGRMLNATQEFLGNDQ